MMYGYGYWGMIIGAVIILVVLLGFVLLVVWAVRRTGNGSGRPQTARDVLDLRYARGEITREQYEQMKQDLTG